MNQLSSTVAYILTWISAVILLRPYLQKIGKVKFWGIMGFAFIYLISYPLYILGFFSPTGDTDTEIMNNILIVSTASIFAGLVFGAAFLSIARTFKRGTDIRLSDTCCLWNVYFLFNRIFYSIPAAYPHSVLFQ